MQLFCFSHGWIERKQETQKSHWTVWFLSLVGTQCESQPSLKKKTFFSVVWILGISLSIGKISIIYIESVCDQKVTGLSLYLCKRLSLWYYVELMNKCPDGKRSIDTTDIWQVRAPKVFNLLPPNFVCLQTYNFNPSERWRVMSVQIESRSSSLFILFHLDQCNLLHPCLSKNLYL